MSDPIVEEATPAPEATPHGDPEEMWLHYGKYPYLLAKFAFFAAIFALIYLALASVGSVLFPLALSLLIAYLLDPLIDAFEARKISRTLAIMITLTLIAGAAVGMIAFLYPLLARQIGTIIEKFPGLLDSLQTEFLPWLEAKTGQKVPPTLSEAFSRYGNEIKGAAPAVLQKGAKWATGLATSTGGLVLSLINAVMIPIFTFYFLRDFDVMRLSLAEYIPRHRKPAIIERLRRVDEVFGAWFRGQIQVALILAALYGLGLGIVFKAFGMSMFDGVALGVISGVLNVIPYVGFAVGFVLSILVILIEWSGWGAVIGVLVVFGVVQSLEGYVITPKIVGEKVGLSPVTVIIVLLLGGEVGGLLGVLLAIPVAGAIKVLLPDLIDWYKASPYFTGKRIVPPPADDDDDAEEAVVALLAHLRTTGQLAAITPTAGLALPASPVIPLHERPEEAGAAPQAPHLAGDVAADSVADSEDDGEDDDEGGDAGADADEPGAARADDEEADDAPMREVDRDSRD